MKQFLTLSLVLMAAIGTTAQTTVKLKINHKLGTKAFTFNQESTNNVNSAFNVTRLEYYISKLSLVHDGGQITDIEDLYILANAENTTDVTLGEYNITKLEAINFNIGVDPGVNNQDPTQWPQSHPLSPKSPSMHWGWSAGYRFVALEGNAGANLNTVFEYHALGNKNYFPLNIPTKGTDDGGDLLITLNADYSKSVHNLELSSGPIIHGDFGDAVKVLRNFQTEVFTSIEGNSNTLGIDQKVEPSISLYPNPTTGIFHLDLPKNWNDTEIILRDMTGRLVQSTCLDSTMHTYSTPERGIYLVSIRNSDGQVLTKRLVVN